MKLIYNGSFEQLKEFGFEIDFREWFQFKDKETGVYVYVMPVSKELKWGASVTEKTGIPKFRSSCSYTGAEELVDLSNITISL